jgi:hypothetical protein
MAVANAIPVIPVVQDQTPVWLVIPIPGCANALEIRAVLVSDAKPTAEPMSVPVRVETPVPLSKRVVSLLQDVLICSQITAIVVGATMLAPKGKPAMQAFANKGSTLLV